MFQFKSHKRSLGLLLSCRCLSSSSGLNIAILTGTSRTEGPPRPILGPRVSQFVHESLTARSHTVSVLDPLELSLPLLQKPEFAFSRSQVPEKLSRLREILEDADAYVCISPEYNHAPSPALLNTLNHFGSSVFSYKPSAIVSYSAGQWGGTRAASALRPILSELGCLPVSAMIHIPTAHDVLNEEGNVIDSPSKWRSYTNRCWAQLEWWGEAAKQHKELVDPFEQSPSFQRNPSQRDAP